MREPSREFLEALTNAEFERAERVCTTELANAYSAGDLGEDWHTFETQLGPFVRIGSSTQTTVRGHQADVVELQFSSGWRRLRIVLDGDRVAGLQYLNWESQSVADPEYVDHDEFSEREVTIGTAADGLLGTLAMPDEIGGGAAVLVHGTGPLDRDGTVGESKPLRDVARGLASAGVPTLRYDKRTTVRSIAPAEQTVERVVVEDAKAALNELNSIANVPVTLIGHSLGGMLAPWIALESSDAVGMVTLAANARPLPALIEDQCRREDGTVPEQVRTGVERITDNAVEPGEIVLGFPGSFWRSLDGYDPVSIACDMDLPLTVLQGDSDEHVSPELDFQRWKTGVPRATCKCYSGVDHLFRADSTTVTERAIADVGKAVRRTGDG
ncbi:alpha/beta fold hydrolase [Natribaculum luteum]|uniref:Alpha/beta fold hydrolase n=1 Tax=Natribaculum luteum TaxID=1586232 RepID=A0ABD5P061_9EURY|nr:alpha/beta fold hydrolase [Natribaculum luteum]